MKHLFTLALMMLLIGCQTTASLETSQSAICTLTLPTVSRLDTPQTILEVDNFSAKFRSACNAEET